MRGAALIFGLLAGLFGAAVVAFGNLDAALAAATGLASHGALAATIVLYTIAALGVLGALLALPWPRLGGLLMLLSAVCWAAVAFFAGHGAVLFAALPFTFVAAGGLVALFAHRDRDELDADEPPAPARRDRDERWSEPEPAYDDDEDFVDGPAYAPPRGRNEPVLRPEPRRAAEPRPQPPTPHYREPPPEDEPDPDDYAAEPEEDDSYLPQEDYIDADPSPADEFPPPDPYEYRSTPPDDPLPDDDEDFSVPPRHRGSGRPDRWSLPDPDEVPPRRQVARPRYVAESQPLPARRQPVPRGDGPLPGRRRPPDSGHDFPVADFPADDPIPEDFPPPRRAGRPRETYRDIVPYDARRQASQPPEQQGGPLRGFLRVLVLLVFILVVVGIAVAVYLDYERGPNSLLFGSHTPQSAALSSRPVTDAAAIFRATTPDTPTTPDETAKVTLANASGPGFAKAPGAVADPGAHTATATPSPMASPFGYCQAVDTIDSPDARYVGPSVPAAVASALGGAGPVAADQVYWRCANKAVLACNAKHSAACEVTPTVDLMLSYCAERPGAKAIPAPNGSWSCNGTHPVIPRDQKWPVDARGFFPGAWITVTQPTG